LRSIAYAFVPVLVVASAASAHIAAQRAAMLAGNYPAEAETLSLLGRRFHSRI
jgi:hypothetical protein